MCGARAVLGRQGDGRVGAAGGPGAGNAQSTSGVAERRKEAAFEKAQVDATSPSIPRRRAPGRGAKRRARAAARRARRRRGVVPPCCRWLLGAESGNLFVFVAVESVSGEVPSWCVQPKSRALRTRPGEVVLERKFLFRNVVGMCGPGPDDGACIAGLAVEGFDVLDFIAGLDQTSRVELAEVQAGADDCHYGLPCVMPADC